MDIVINTIKVLFYVVIFVFVSVLLAIAIGQEPAFFAGENILFLLAAYFQYTLKDFFRSLAITAALSFFFTYSSINQLNNILFIEFLKCFYPSLIIINITSFIYISIDKIFVIIKKQELIYNMKLTRMNIYYIFASFYSLLGLLMVLFPPRFKYREYENKFVFFGNINKIDLSFFLYEIISYIFIGSIIYFLFFRSIFRKNFEK